MDLILFGGLEVILHKAWWTSLKDVCGVLKETFYCVLSGAESYLKLNKNQIRDSVRIVDVKLSKRSLLKELKYKRIFKNIYSSSGSL